MNQSAIKESFLNMKCALLRILLIEVPW